jgi:hypothetical protein
MVVGQADWDCAAALDLRERCVEALCHAAALLPKPGGIRNSPGLVEKGDCPE